MKAYLVTTGTLFGLLAAMHLVRVIEKWHLFANGRVVCIGYARDHTSHGRGVLLGMAAVLAVQPLVKPLWREKRTW